MKIQKKYLKLLLDILVKTTPNFVEARFRDRFINRVDKEFEIFERERVHLCESLCEKNKEKKPIFILGKEGNLVTKAYKFSDKKQVEFDKQFKILLDEECKILLEDDENKRLIKLIESTQYVPMIGEADLIYQNIIEKIEPGAEKKTKSK